MYKFIIIFLFIFKLTIKKIILFIINIYYDKFNFKFI